MIAEVAKSPAAPRTYLVNPRYEKIGTERVYPGLADLPEPPDLALLAVPDAALAEQMGAAAEAGVRSVVIFGSAFDPHGNHLRESIAATARDAAMHVCGAGCMGFVNVARGLRAIGYVERDPLPAGPVALVTHSGSVFSALLRTRRAFGFTIAVSSGQELVTPAAAYARYALSLPETKVLALVLEAIRDAPLLRDVLGAAAERDVPVVLLPAGASARGRTMVAAHSGALAAGDGAWQALAAAYGVHRVGDLAELADTLELFCAGRRPRTAGRGLATVHDSGFERAHVTDVAADAGVEFAAIGAATRRRLAGVLDPGLEPGNPLDVWGTGRDTRELFTEAMSALAADPAVGAVALAVDLVPEYDEDDSYPQAALAVAAATDKPVAVLASVPAAIDQQAAARLRAAGVPVLESTRSGLLALRHLLAPRVTAPPAARRRRDVARRDRWAARLADGASGAELLGLLRDYGIPAARAASASTLADALAAAADIGYPVALKTDEPGIAHKTDVGGVRLGIAWPRGAGRRLCRSRRPARPARRRLPDGAAGSGADRGDGPRPGSRSADRDRSRRGSRGTFSRTYGGAAPAHHDRRRVVGVPAPLRGGARRGPWQPALRHRGGRRGDRRVLGADRRARRLAGGVRRQPADLRPVRRARG